MSRRGTVEVVAAHHTLEALALGGADDIHPSTLFKELAARVLSTLCRKLGGLHAELLEELRRLDTQLLEVTGNRLAQAALLLSVEGNLDSGVTVLIRRLNLGEGVTGYIDDGDGDHGTGLLVEDAGHTNLFTNKS